MKELVRVPVNGYLFWSIIRMNCNSRFGRCFSVIKVVHETRQEVVRKPALYSKKQKNIHISKMFSSYTQNPLALMDFDVWLHPNILQMIKDFYYIKFVLRGLDNFSLCEFVKCSDKALEVVTTLLSQHRFSELDGLLTPECKEEVQKNLQNWSRYDASVLSVEPKQLLNSHPCGIVMFPDEKNKEKYFTEIRVIYYVWLKYSEMFERMGISDATHKMLMRQNHRNLHMGSVFNIKFITEVTKGSTGHWIINAINLKCFPHVFLKY